MMQYRSMWQIIFRQFFKNRMAVIGLATIVLFMGCAAFAPWIANVLGVNPDQQNVFHRYKGLWTSIETSRDQQESAIEQAIDQNPERAQVWTKALLKEQLVISEETSNELIFEFWDAHSAEEALQRLRTTKNPELSELEEIFESFAKVHFLGTDDLGRDVFIRLIYGTRVSILVALLVALVSSLIGLTIGSFAGYYGGWLDALLMRLTDSVLSLPFIAFFIVLAKIDFAKLPFLNFLLTSENESVVKLVFILCLFSWMPAARLIRGQILSLKNQEFIQAAIALGATDLTVMIKHLIPNSLAPLLIAATLGIGNSILFEAALSFLGLGIQPPTPSWGNMLNNAQELIAQAPHLAIMPGVLILLTVVSFNFLGDGLQDALDPKALKASQNQ